MVKEDDLDEKTKYKTAFITKQGPNQFNVAPQAIRCRTTMDKRQHSFQCFMLVQSQWCSGTAFDLHLEYRG